MKIFAKPINHVTFRDAEIGTVFDVKGELYMKIKYDCNNPEKNAVHLGTGAVINVSEDADVLVADGYFVRDFEI